MTAGATTVVPENMPMRVAPRAPAFGAFPLLTAPLGDPAETVRHVREAIDYEGTVGGSEIEPAEDRPPDSQTMSIERALGCSRQLESGSTSWRFGRQTIVRPPRYCFRKAPGDSFARIRVSRNANCRRVGRLAPADS